MLDCSRDGYSRTVERLAEAHRPADADLCRAADRPRLGVRPAARRLPAGRRPGLYHHRRADAVRTPPTPAPRPRSSRSKNICCERAGVENVTFLTGFSFLGQGMNTAQAFITLKDWSERGPKDSAAAIVADINRDLSSIRDAKISALQPPPIDNLGNSSGFSLPPAGPRPEGLSGAGRRRRPADRGGQCEPGAAEGLCRGPAAGAAGQSDDRPRKGRRVRRHLRGHQQHDLDQSRLELHQRLPEPRPDAARDRAGRPRQPHERRRHPQLQRQEQPRPAGAVLRLRHGRMVEGPDPDRGLQLLSRRCASRGEAKPGFTSGDAIAEMERLAGKLPRGFGFEWTGQSLQEKLSGSQAPFLLGAVGAGGVPAARRAL